MRMTLKQAVAIAAVVVSPSLVESSDPSNPRSVADYYDSSQGFQYVVSSEVKRDGHVVRTSQSAVTAMPPAELDGHLLQVRRSKVTMKNPSGDTFSGLFDLFQKADHQTSCTYAMGPSDAEPERYDCDYLDLKAPVEKGASWTFTAKMPLYNWDVPELVIASVETRIESIESVDISGMKLADCVKILEVANATPDAMIACSDGTKSKTSVRVERERMLCPGLPDFSDTTTEVYSKRSQDQETCTTFEAVSKVTSVELP
jgi:hypothetical protein